MVSVEGSWNQFPTDTKGQLIGEGVKSPMGILDRVGLPSLTPTLFKYKCILTISPDYKRGSQNVTLFSLFPTDLALLPLWLPWQMAGSEKTVQASTTQPWLQGQPPRRRYCGPNPLGYWLGGLSLMQSLPGSVARSPGSSLRDQSWCLWPRWLRSGALPTAC